MTILKLTNGVRFKDPTDSDIENCIGELDFNSNWGVKYERSAHEYFEVRKSKRTGIVAIYHEPTPKKRFDSISTTISKDDLVALFQLYNQNWSPKDFAEIEWNNSRSSREILEVVWSFGWIAAFMYVLLTVGNDNISLKLFVGLTCAMIGLMFTYYQIWSFGFSSIFSKNTRSTTNAVGIFLFWLGSLINYLLSIY